MSAGAEGKCVSECVQERGSKGRHIHSQRERETCCHRKASVLTRSGRWKSQQPLREVTDPAVEAVRR